MSGSAVLTNPIDRDTPVWTRKIVFTFVSGNIGVVTQPIDVNGILQKIIAVCSAPDGAAVTGRLQLDDAGGIPIFIVAALAEGSINQYSLSEPVAGTIALRLTPSTDPLSDYTVTVYLRGIE